jgi:transposase
VFRVPKCVSVIQVGSLRHHEGFAGQLRQHKHLQLCNGCRKLSARPLLLQVRSTLPLYNTHVVAPHCRVREICGLCVSLMIAHSSRLLPQFPARLRLEAPLVHPTLRSSHLF